MANPYEPPRLQSTPSDRALRRDDPRIRGLSRTKRGCGIAIGFIAIPAGTVVVVGDVARTWDESIVGQFPAVLLLGIGIILAGAFSMRARTSAIALSGVFAAVWLLYSVYVWLEPSRNDALGYFSEGAFRTKVAVLAAPGILMLLLAAAAIVCELRIRRLQEGVEPSDV